MQYDARLKLAQAESEAAIKRSQGEQASKMVDITVEREEQILTELRTRNP